MNVKRSLTRMTGGCVCLMSVVLGLCGCATSQRQAVTDARMRSEIMNLREDLVRVRGRVEGMEMEYQRMYAEIEKLNAATSRVGEQTGNIIHRLEQQERGLAEISGARVRDREAIVEELSARMAEVLAGSGAPASRTVPVGTTGYEHIVRAGETLSEIAAAYKVRVGAIIEANDLKDPNMLRQGQKLFIPK